MCYTLLCSVLLHLIPCSILISFFLCVCCLCVSICSQCVYSEYILWWGEKCTTAHVMSDVYIFNIESWIPLTVPKPAFLKNWNWVKIIATAIAAAHVRNIIINKRQTLSTNNVIKFVYVQWCTHSNEQYRQESLYKCNRHRYINFFPVYNRHENP